jgi:hypothetical protein
MKAFNSFNFTIQQTQYMKNSNLQYECNDAQDDFSAQLEKDNSSGGVFNQWMSSEDIADLNGYEFHDGANFEQENDDEFNAEKYTTVGRLAQIKQNEMTATRMALENVGWTDQPHTGLEQIDKTPVIPEHMHNGLKWKGKATTNILSLHGVSTCALNKGSGPRKKSKEIQDDEGYETYTVYIRFDFSIFDPCKSPLQMMSTMPESLGENRVANAVASNLSSF